MPYNRAILHTEMLATVPIQNRFMTLSSSPLEPTLAQSVVGVHISSAIDAPPF